MHGVVANQQVAHVITQQGPAYAAKLRAMD
jgi:hypothetical protein